MFNEVGCHLQRVVHLNIRKTSPQTGKLLLFYRYLVIYKGDFSIDCLIFQGSKLFNIPFFNISADRALIVDIIFNRADSELVILAEKKEIEIQNAKFILKAAVLWSLSTQQNFPLEPRA